MKISEFYEKEVNEGELEKTKAEVLIYANTHSKLNEIIERFVYLKSENEMFTNKANAIDRATISKRLNETIFDDDYLEKKANKITNQYCDEYGNIKGDQV